MKPTQAWQSHVAHTEGRYPRDRHGTRRLQLPFDAVPFVAGTSTEPSQSLGGNIQQVLAMLKQQGRPLHPQGYDPFSRFHFLTVSFLFPFFIFPSFLTYCASRVHVHEGSDCLDGIALGVADSDDEEVLLAEHNVLASRKSLIRHARDAQHNLKAAGVAWVA